MKYIPLVEHSRPRIVMLDFSSNDIDKVKKAGFEVYRGTSGIYDRNEFYFPFAVQDVEILFAYVQNNSFSATDRVAHAESVEQKPFFADMLREIWEKGGWSILFVAHNTQPHELESLGLEHVGVIARNRMHLPASMRGPIQKAIEERRKRTYNLSPLSEPESIETPIVAHIPQFIGTGVVSTQEPESAILERFIKSANMSVFTCLGRGEFSNNAGFTDHPYITVFSNGRRIVPLMLDDSASQNVLALKLKHYIDISRKRTEPMYHKGGILILPDFGSNNINVALALLQDTISHTSPHLFDNPQHPWLANYEVASILRLQDQNKAVIQEAQQKIQEINALIEVERKKFGWLLGLLVSLEDQFASNTADALRFLGFEVEDLDAQIAPGERKREDFWITDPTTGYFALGEAKTTGKTRGATEDFISKTQTHILRYAREQGAVPPALLIINYATDIDPTQRASRFYQKEVAGRLEENGITAINSVALHHLCQYVLNDQLSAEQVRRFISNRQPMINVVSVEAVLSALS